MRISDWSSDVCSSDLPQGVPGMPGYCALPLPEHCSTISCSTCSIFSRSSLRMITRKGMISPLSSISQPSMSTGFMVRPESRSWMLRTNRCCLSVIRSPASNLTGVSRTNGLSEMTVIRGSFTSRIVSFETDASFIIELLFLGIGGSVLERVVEDLHFAEGEGHLGKIGRAHV